MHMERRKSKTVKITLTNNTPEDSYYSILRQHKAAIIKTVITEEQISVNLLEQNRET